MGAIRPADLVARQRGRKGTRDIIFTGDAGGYGNVSAPEAPDFDHLPDVEDN